MTQFPHFNALLEQVLSDPVAAHAFWRRMRATPSKLPYGAEYHRRARRRRRR